METKTEVESQPVAATRSWPQRIWHEMRTHPMAYIILGLFVLAGPFVTAFLFPEAPIAVGIIGGAAFGAYAALCAVPGQFL